MLCKQHDSSLLSLRNFVYSICTLTYSHVSIMKLCRYRLGALYTYFNVRSNCQHCRFGLYLLILGIAPDAESDLIEFFKIKFPKVMVE
jgi:hypothetical protein